MPLILVLVAASSGGCGTLDNIKRPILPPPIRPDAPVCRCYGGVRGDWAIMSDYPWSRTVSFLDYVFIPVLAGVDLAFDVGGDTVTLPYTLYAEIRRATHHPEAPGPLDGPVVPDGPGPAIPLPPIPPGAAETTQRPQAVGPSAPPALPLGAPRPEPTPRPPR